MLSPVVHASHNLQDFPDRSTGPTWCSLATCDLARPTHILWGHGSGAVIASCIDQASYTVTPVDTINVTVWAPDAHNTLYTTVDGEPEQDMDLIVQRRDGIMLNVRT